MFAATNACTVLGSRALPITVEATVERGLPAMRIIGMPGQGASETRERVLCGIRSLGVDASLKHITVSIAPADLPKAGAALDLPIALAVLAAMGELTPAQVACIGSHGEVGLDGNLRAARGVIATALTAHRRSWSELLVPASAAGRASHAPCPVIPIASLRDAVLHLTGREPIPRSSAGSLMLDAGNLLDLGDVRGQAAATEATIVAAAGGHHLLLFGVPGCGKTMLAHRLPTLLPPLRDDEALEVATIHDAAGLDPASALTGRPFRAPHHTSTVPALVGGGGVRPLVGEVTLAHRGVLFLDELPEFRPSAIDALREPLEEREIRIRRATWSLSYPCDSQVVAAMNLCRCGKLGSPTAGDCTCTAPARHAYLQRVSGAIVDRFDIRVRMRAPTGTVFAEQPDTGLHERAASRIEQAWAIQHERWGAARLNGSWRQVGDPRFALDIEARTMLDGTIARLGCGGRVQRAVVRVARTIADLAGSATTTVDHVLEALELCRTSPTQEHTGG